MAKGEQNMDRGAIMTKSKTMLGVSVLALALSACGGDDQTAASSSTGSDGLWTWSSPDAWYETGGQPASAPAPAQPQQASAPTASAQTGASAQMTTQTYEVEEIDPVTGRVSRRTVTETVPVSGSAMQGSGGASVSASVAAPTVSASTGGTVIPAGKLPSSGFGAADTRNANYSGSVRGSMGGSVAGAPAAAPTVTVDAAPVAMPEPVAAPRVSSPSTSPDVLLPSDMTGGASSRQGPLVTSPAVAASGRTVGSFDRDYLDLENGSTQRFTREPGMTVSERMVELETEVVMDYDARWSDLEFDGGAMRQQQQQAMAGPQATMPYMGGQSAAATALSSTIPFAAGSVNLSTTDRRRILEAVVAQQSRGGVIEVVGHAAAPSVDRSGAISGYDLALARANKVGKAMVDAGVPASAVRLLVMGTTGQAKVDIVLR